MHYSITILPVVCLLSFLTYEYVNGLFQGSVSEYVLSMHFLVKCNSCFFSCVRSIYSLQVPALFEDINVKVNSSVWARLNA